MAFMLDGANLVDPGNQGTQIANINGDMVSEVKVLFSSYGAEYRQGPGGLPGVQQERRLPSTAKAICTPATPIFNSREAFQKSQGIAKPTDYQYYPGGNIGGPC